MDVTAIRHTELPGASRLFLDYLYSFERLRGFFTHVPGNLGSIGEAARSLSYPESRRAALVEALREDNAPSAALDLLSRPGTVAVVTGQQVGLFGGPAYSVYKALTAVKLARSLSDAGIPAVPVFWCATEDHDFEEVRHVWIFDGASRPVRLSVEAASGGAPAGAVAPGEFPLAALREALSEFPFGEEVANGIAAHYRPGRTMGEAFRGWMAALLQPFELLFLDPLRPAVRKLAAPLLGRAAELSSELTEAVADRSRALLGAGYHSQVQVTPGAPLFFALSNGKRTPLRESPNGFQPLIDAPETISPNALLRPVMQDFILPVAAHVAGPAEIAYLAQSQVLYEKLGVPQPVEWPRAGFTLLDARSAKVMDRYGLTLSTILAGEETVAEAIARRRIPSELASAFDAARRQVREALAALRAPIAAFDSTLAAALDKSSAKMLYQLAKIERKTGREVLRRQEAASADAARLSRLVAPHRHLQERFYSIVPFVAWHGTGLISRLYSHIRLDSPDHILLPL